jgi:hypothetical protein
VVHGKPGGSHSFSSRCLIVKRISSFISVYCVFHLVLSTLLRSLLTERACFYGPHIAWHFY